LIDFEQDAIIPSDNALARVRELVDEQVRLQAELAALEQQVSDKAKELRQVEEQDLPDAMSAAGVESFTTSEGVVVKIKDDISISLAGEKMQNALRWLREHGHDDLIKAEVTITVPKGTDKKILARLYAGIERLKLKHDTGENVHTQTFKALLREQLEKGKEVDLSSLGAWKWRKSKITLPK
jgi:hypothetical protein